MSQAFDAHGELKRSVLGDDAEWQEELAEYRAHEEAFRKGELPDTPDRADPSRVMLWWILGVMAIGFLIRWFYFTATGLE